jgi:hypothetical protein
MGYVPYVGFATYLRATVMTRFMFVKKKKKVVTAQNSFVEVREYLVERCNSKELAMLAEIARRIWFRRNTVVHGGVLLHPKEVIRSATSFIINYREAMERPVGG